MGSSTSARYPKQQQLVNPYNKQTVVQQQNQNNDEQNDIFIFYTIKISLKKLRQLTDHEQINNLRARMTILSKHDPSQLLNFIPNYILPAVISFTGNKCNFKALFERSLLYNHMQPLKLIYHINFQNLIDLDLCKTNTTSLEPFVLIQAPRLRQLHINNNSISSLNILQKAEFPALVLISFYCNPIKYVQRFSRFRSKKLTHYQFDADNISVYDYRLQDYRFLFKMENMKAQKIKMKDRQRMDISKRPFFSILQEAGADVIYTPPRKNGY